MPDMPLRNISKGQMMRSLDEFFSAPRDPSFFDEAIAKLNNRKIDLVDIWEEYGLADKEQLKHLSKHWLGDGPMSYWPTHYKKEQIIRAGFVRALEQAKEHNLPIDNQWICAGHHFQVAVTYTPRQIQILYLTPHAKILRNEPASDVLENTWIVANEIDIDNIRRPALEHWFGHDDPVPVKGKTAWKGIYETQIYGD